MLNCSTCHRGKPEAHFYANPSHRAHIPVDASPDDNATLARLLADGLLPTSAARQTPTASRSTLAGARATLATSGRPVESERERIARERAQARAVEREENAAREAEEEDAPLPWWMKAGLWVGGILVAGALAYGGYQQAHQPYYPGAPGEGIGDFPGDFPAR